MKEKTKTVYYCDFCKKYRLTRNSMVMHESSCTLNPERVCRVCGCDGNCPWCAFSKRRLMGDMQEYEDGHSVGEKMKEWWAKQEKALIIATYER